MDATVWALVHANTPGRVNESASELEDRVTSMCCSAGRADGLQYWGSQLLRTHERTELALDECALALAMSQHVNLGIGSRVAELGADLIEGMGLWDHSEPHGPWGNARFMTQFVWAYAKAYLHAKALQGVQMRKNLKQNYASGH